MGQRPGERLNRRLPHAAAACHCRASSRAVPAYGVDLSAPLVRACPVADMSWPTPAVVWQAPSKGAIPISTSTARLIQKLLRMALVLLCDRKHRRRHSRERVPQLRSPHMRLLGRLLGGLAVRLFGELVGGIGLLHCLA